jgi:hypothetical protein
MISLESLVTDLATSQLLKAAGFPQDTAFKWVSVPQGWINGGGCGVDENGIVHQIPLTPTGGYANEVMPSNTTSSLDVFLCSAPTAEEILRALPATIEITEGIGTAHYIWHVYRSPAGWAVSYCSAVPPGGYRVPDLSPTLATAAARTYLWWKESWCTPYDAQT